MENEKNCGWKMAEDNNNFGGGGNMSGL